MPPGRGTNKNTPFRAKNESNLPFDFLKRQVALVWRRGWDSNPRAVSDKLISSQNSLFRNKRN